jgi:hypothetical protein
MNIASQNTINDLGQIVEKERLTHDQSFEWSSGHSVNNRVNHALYVRESVTPNGELGSSSQTQVPKQKNLCI